MQTTSTGITPSQADANREERGNAAGRAAGCRLGAPWGASTREDDATTASSRARSGPARAGRDHSVAARSA
jgi:hypothetical protein